MEEKQDEYMTQTNLMTCENVVDYCRSKYAKVHPVFKPEGSKSVQVKILTKDLLTGDSLLSRYQVSDKAHLGLRRGQEYSVDCVDFTAADEKGEMLSKGSLVVCYDAKTKWFLLFLFAGENKIVPIIKITQKKKLFHSFPTEMVEDF